MDASASAASDTKISNLCSLFVKIENTFPEAIKEKKTVTKYTRLPEFDFIYTGKWPKSSYSLEPRLRRIIAIEEPLINSPRSLRSNVPLINVPKMAAYSKRKIVTIEEDDERSLHPKFSHDIKTSYSKMLNKAVEAGIKEQKLPSQRTTSRLSSSTRYSQDVKQNIKANSYSNSKRNISVSNIRSKPMKENDPLPKSKEESRNTRPANVSKYNFSKKSPNPSESDKEIQIIKNKLKDEYKTPPSKRVTSREKVPKLSTEHSKVKTNLMRGLSDKKKSPSVIHVPLEVGFGNQAVDKRISSIEAEIKSKMNHRSTDVSDLRILHDVNLSTDPPKQVNQETDTVDLTHSSDEYKDKTAFDSLKIPNVTLINDKFEESKENLVNFCSKSQPNLRVPTFSIAPNEKEVPNETFHKSNSYIISRATLTYTTKQKIDFHVVENKIDVDITPSTVGYPLNVISVYKKELQEKKSDVNSVPKEDQSKNQTELNPENNSIYCFKTLDSNKLMKPSDIISSIKADSSLLPNDYINEQFQRELNFIDSFFESLQFLENCSLSEKRLSQSNVDDLINSAYDVKKLQYDSFFSKFENSNNVDDSETIASKSLCLLNLLIRDEQRRAKNLLFVLKMREDALKDFTKSQILWLENRKKQDNTDISTLKKKQRGALLKLQHECGEMQRMRKALLTLSEKRKVALMKTKRNIELKFKNNVDVEQIIMDKRKLKRSTSSDRNTPLKCFDLSSSGCEESTTSRPKSVTPASVPLVESSRSVEKCVQTGDSILSSTNQSTSTADENFVVVDGGYLNILFQNLSLPEIFSSGKQYEVNEEALRNIVATTNNKTSIKEGDVIKSFMDQVKSHELERSSSPSTARSLVEELDQYYKGLNESPVQCDISEVKDIGVQISEDWKESANKVSEVSVESVERECVCEPLSVSVDTQCVRGKDDPVGSVAGPLPVPAGEAAVTESTPQDLTWPDQKSSSSSPGEGSSIGSPILYPSATSLITPAQSEAEELRRQELAIEREIKAIQQQQQCQQLIVREIPDKPPPPYTPPSDSRAPKKRFILDDNNKEKVHKYFAEMTPEVADDSDPFDVFLRDYWQETRDRHHKELGDKFWDTCHEIPPKTELDVEKLAKKATADLKEVFTCVTPTIVSGVGARRSDHIDDILFAEWRRCEPEWTSLHTDEVIVKNQIFESIFQKILTETVDEYKKSVLSRNEHT